MIDFDADASAQWCSNYVVYTTARLPRHGDRSAHADIAQFGSGGVR